MQILIQRQKLGSPPIFEALVKVFRDAVPLALERIVSQIYNQLMLGVVKRVYSFKNIIYTLYQTGDGDDSVVAFCKITTYLLWLCRRRGYLIYLLGN